MCEEREERLLSSRMNVCVVACLAKMVQRNASFQGLISLGIRKLMVYLITRMSVMDHSTWASAPKRGYGEIRASVARYPAVHAQPRANFMVARGG